MEINIGPNRHRKDHAFVIEPGVWLLRAGRIWIILVLVLLPLLVLETENAQAVTPIYVRPDGNDSECDGSTNVDYPGGTGPLACAKQTVAAGISVVDPGGTVVIAAGTFAVNINLSKDVTLLGQGAGVTMLDGGDLDRVLRINSGYSLNASDLTIQNGNATSTGGGVFVLGTASLSDCAILDNVAQDGGGLSNSGSTTITGCEISGNEATGYPSGGGGVRNAGDMSILNSTIHDNHVTNLSGTGGGGIENSTDSGESLLVDRVTIYANSATAMGGGIKDQGQGETTLVNSTVAHNTGESVPGIMKTSSGTLNIINTTIAENSPSNPSNVGGVMAYGSVTFVNTIIHENGAYPCGVIGGTLTSYGYNIEQSNTCNFDQPSDMPSTDAKLGPLQDNGGPTLTMPLLGTSPAIDAGDGTTCSTAPVSGVDQRGVGRPQGGGCDVGAYERVLEIPVDFTNNKKSDVVVFRSGAWRFFTYSTGTFHHGVWTGTSPGCIPAPMDYDGDGKVEPTQLCGGAWHFYNYDGTYYKGIWTGGVPGDLPVPADYNGDGVDQVVIWRAGAWRFFDFSTGAFDHGVWTGSPPHWLGGVNIPAPMDYDGDGAAEFTVFSGGPWHFYDDDGSYAKGIWTGGVADDLPVPADYDDDGYEEVVVWRAGAWRFYDYATASFDHGVWTGAPPHWLGGTPLPSPLDVDGDGDAEFTVFSGGPWHFYNANGSYDKGIWTGGVAGDLPISRRLLP